MWEWMRGMDEYYIKCLVGVTLISTIILLIRCFFAKKLSKRFVYGMWLAIPLFLLLVPWVRIPMPQLVADLGQETWEKLEGEVYTIVLPKDMQMEMDALAEAVQNGYMVGSEFVGSSSINSENDTIETKNVETILAKVMVALYGLIILAILACIVSTNVRFEHNCRHNRFYVGETPKHKLPVYRLEDITSPFLLCATMYVPDGMTEDELRYAMLHEEGHFRHGDFFWVITRYVILAAFFYNPIVWLAFRYSGYDCELACDESVMRRIKATEHRAYGGSLLDVIKKRRGIGQRVLLSTNMKAPKKLIRARIENIVAGRKGSVLVTCLASLVVLLVTGCSFMEQKEDGADTLISLETGAEDKASASSKEQGALQNQQSVPEINKHLDNDVVDYGDTVYFCAELLREDPDVAGSFTTVMDKHEIFANFSEEEITSSSKSSMAAGMLSYLSETAMGKKVGDTIQFIRELEGVTYHYFYLITGINVEGGKYEFPKGWNDQFPEPVIGQFYDAGNDKPDFGFEGRELETGMFSVPFMREYYTVATATSYLDAVGTNGYHPGNVTGYNKANAWAEGVEGSGIGEAIELHQMYMGPGAERLTFTRFCIVNGYAKNKDIWEKNARVKELAVYYGGVYLGRIQLKDCMEPQYIDVSSLNMTIANGREAVFKFVIRDVYPGTKYEDTCLTGILIEFSR